MTAMDVYFPFDAGAGADSTEARWREMARYWLYDGVIWPEDTSNRLSVYGDSSGLQVKVKTGACWIRGHRGQTTSEKTLAIASNSSGNPRIDRVVARADFTANTVELAVVAGTPTLR